MKLIPNRLRRKVLDMIYNSNSGHIGGSFSLAETITVLYNNFDLLGEDKLILSKGHAVPIIYAALHELGRITDKELDSFRHINSPLQGHPDKNLLKDIHATTGSLGQGLSIAIGHAMAKKLKKESGKVFCILGDGEVQEGQIWEALMYAPTQNLDNLVVLIDFNKCQSEQFVEGHFPDFYRRLPGILNRFGWRTITCNGHNEDILKDILLKEVPNNKPTVLVLDTIKGKGVSFMESKEWHSKVPNYEEYKLAIKELEQ